MLFPMLKKFHPESKRWGNRSTLMCSVVTSEILKYLNKKQLSVI